MFRLALVCCLALAVVCAAQSSTLESSTVVSTTAVTATAVTATASASSSAVATVTATATAATATQSSSAPAAVTAWSSSAVVPPVNVSSTLASTGPHGNNTNTSVSSSAAPLVPSSSTAAPVVLPVTSLVGYNVLNVTNVSVVSAALESLMTAVYQNVTGHNITFGACTVQQIATYSWNINTYTYVNTTNTTWVAHANITQVFNSTTNTTTNVTTYTYTQVNTTVLTPIIHTQTFTVCTLQVMQNLTTPGALYAPTAATLIKSAVLALAGTYLNPHNVTLGSTFFCDSAVSGFSVACPASGFVPIYVHSSTAVAAPSSTAVTPVASTAPAPQSFLLYLAVDVVFNNASSISAVSILLPQLTSMLPLVTGCKWGTLSSSTSGLTLKVIQQATCDTYIASQTAAVTFKTSITNSTALALATAYPGHLDAFYCGSAAASFTTVCPATGFTEYVAPTPSNGGGGDSGLSTNAKIGIAVGVGGGGLLIIILIIVCCCCCKGDKGSSSGAGTEMMGAA